jgi:hypothetical protein
MVRSPLEAIGASFRALRVGADLDLRDMDAAAPELKHIEPGPQWLRVAMERFFVDTMPAQYAGLQQLVGSAFEP